MSDTMVKAPDGQWISLKGPKGDKGDPGADGVGNQAFSLLVEPPPNTLGIDGDVGFYFPEPGTPARLWRKVDGAWAFDRDLPF